MLRSTTSSTLVDDSYAYTRDELCIVNLFILISVEPTAFQLISTFLEKAGAVEGQVVSLVVFKL